MKIQGSWHDVYSSPLTPNEWHHIAGVWMKGGSIKIYVDGVLAGENTAIPNSYPSDIGPSWLPSIGVYNRGSERDTFFEGLIDDVRIYNRVLSEAEIEALYLGIFP